MPLSLCCALLSGVGKACYDEKPRKVPLNIKDVERCKICSRSDLAFISLYSSSLFLRKVPVLKPVLIGRVNESRLVLHQFSHSSVKIIVMCKSHCNSLCLCSFWKFLLLVLVKIQVACSAFFLASFALSRFVSARLGRLHGCLFGCLHIQLRKDLDATYCFFALCLFLCHVLWEVNVLCIKY